MKACGNDTGGDVLLDRMKLAGYLGERVWYCMGVFLNIKADEGTDNFMRVQAKYLTRAIVEAQPSRSKKAAWSKARAMLIDEAGEKQKPSLKDLDAAGDKRVEDFLPEFDAAYGFKDCLEDLNKR